MEIVIAPSSERAEALTARILADRILAKPDAVLGLATGRTMERVYHQLRKTNVSFRDVTTFNLDEYIGLPAFSKESYWHYMHEHLFHHVDILEENVHLPDGTSADLKGAAREYEEKIAKAGGIDVQLLGIGRAGHIGFNEPLSSFTSRTRDKTLTKTTRIQNSSMFGGDVSAVPERAITMGVGTILEARELLLLATGAEKAEIVAKALEGPLTSMVSASAVQIHRNCKIILDEAAAAALSCCEYYRHAFQIDPDWAAYRSLFEG